MYLQGTPEFEHHVATYGPQTEFGYKDFIPQFTAEQFDPRRLGRAVPPGRRAVRRAGRRAPRRLRDVRQRPLRAGTRPRWGRSATSSASWPTRCAPRADLRRSPRHRAEHWWFFNGGMTFDSDVQDPRSPTSTARRSARSSEPDRGSSSTTGWPARSRSSTSISRSSLVRLVDRAARLRAVPRSVRRVLLQPGRRSGGGGVAINYKYDALRRRAPRSSTSSAASWRRSAADALAERHLGREELLGLHRNQDYKTSGSILVRTWSISSARTARCCSTSARGRRHDSRAEERAAAWDRRLAGRQRRGDLRHDPVDGFRRGPDPGRGLASSATRHRVAVHRRPTSASPPAADIVYATALRLARPTASCSSEAWSATRIWLGWNCSAAPIPYRSRQLPHGLAVSLPPAGPDSTLPVLRITPAVRDPAARRLEVRN